MNNIMDSYFVVVDNTRDPKMCYPKNIDNQTNGPCGHEDRGSSFIILLLLLLITHDCVPRNPFASNPPETMMILQYH